MRKPWRQVSPFRSSIILAGILVVSSSTAAAIVSEDADPGVPYCPTPGQVEAHAEATGQDLKPTISCRDGNDPADENASAPTPPGPPITGDDIAAIRAMAARDPHIVAGVDPDSPKNTYTMTIVEGAPFPDWVDTPEEADLYLGTDAP